MFLIYHLMKDFVVKIVQQENFLHVVDLSFDERFAEYYCFSLH